MNSVYPSKESLLPFVKQLELNVSTLVFLTMASAFVTSIGKERIVKCRVVSMVDFWFDIKKIINFLNFPLEHSW